MNRIYLIARREYLSYVAAPGFWISLIAIPLLLVAAVMAPLVIGQAEPARAVAVISDDPALERVVSDAIDGGNLQAGQQPLPGDAMARYVVVPAPATTAEALTPWLVGERTVSTPQGELSLSAALFVTRTPDGGTDLQVWSTSLADREPVERAERALGDLMRAEALGRAGLSTAEIDRVDDLWPSVASFDPRRTGAEAEVQVADRAPFFVSVALSYLLFMLIFSVANMLLSSVIEEKQARILDTLMTSARLTEVLAGKLLGVAMVSLTLLTVWGVTAVTAARLGAGADPDGVVAGVFEALSDPVLIGMMAAYFLVGYLMYGAIFIGIGALCENLQEAQTLMGPVIVILMIPMLLILVAINTPDSEVVRTMAWVPLFAPFLGILRVPTEPPLLELLGPLVLAAATVPLALWVSAHLMRAGTVDQAAGAAMRRLLSFGRMGR